METNTESPFKTSKAIESLCLKIEDHGTLTADIADICIPLSGIHVINQPVRPGSCQSLRIVSAWSSFEQGFALGRRANGKEVFLWNNGYFCFLFFGTETTILKKAQKYLDSLEKEQEKREDEEDHRRLRGRKGEIT